MKKTLSRQEAKEEIQVFFNQKEILPENLKKIKRIAMKYKISLKEHRKRFCKKCLSDLKSGKIRISKTHKTIECPQCLYKNKYKIKKSFI